MSGTGAGNSTSVIWGPGFVLCTSPAPFVVLNFPKKVFFLNFGNEDEIPLHCIFIPFYRCYCFTEKMNLIMNYHVLIAPHFPFVSGDLCSHL